MAIEIITQLHDNSMYLLAVQEVPYLNRNVTILSPFYVIESLYDCYHVASFSTIQFGFFQMQSDRVEENYRDTQTKILQNK